MVDTGSTRQPARSNNNKVRADEHLMPLCTASTKRPETELRCKRATGTDSSWESGEGRRVQRCDTPDGLTLRPLGRKASKVAGCLMEETLISRSDPRLFLPLCCRRGLSAGIHQHFVRAARVGHEPMTVTACASAGSPCTLNPEPDKVQ